MNGRGQGSAVSNLRLVAENGRRLASEERELHVLDVENGVGSGLLTRADVRSLMGAYQSSVRPCAGAQFVGATSSAPGLLQAALGWGPGPRWMHEDGPDGADQCLIEELAHPKTAERFTHVFVLSGDHIFVDSVAALVTRGIRVTVVSRPTALNFRLRLEASNVIYLPESRTDSELKAA